MRDILVQIDDDGHFATRFGVPSIEPSPVLRRFVAAPTGPGTRAGAVRT